MEMKMKSVWLFLLFLVSLGVMSCQGCWKHEREALLRLSAHFDNPYMRVDGTDCCQWDTVVCNTTTGRVMKLYLSYMRDYSPGYWHLNYSEFQVFEDLKSLILFGNYIDGCVENAGLENLEVLNLSYNSLNNTASILSCLNGLSSLKDLSLRDNKLNATSILQAFETLSSKLLKLEVLDLGDNHLTNDFLPFLGRFTSLNELYLENTSLHSDLHIQGLSSMLINLEVLDISRNNFNDSNISSSLSGFSSLKSLYLSDAQLTPRTIYSLASTLINLEVLDLSRNNFNDIDISSFLRGLSSLKSLDLSECQLTPRSIHNMSNLSSLETLNRSRNVFDNTTTSWSLERTELLKLEELDVSGNEIAGPLPASFGNMTSLRMLDLSMNHFTGNFGSHLATLTSLEYLDFRDNQFEVPISFTPFANLSNLKFINGKGNKVILDSQPTSQTWVPKFQLQELQLSSTIETSSLPLPNFLLYQYNLSILKFESIKLEWQFPTWLLENNTRMESFGLTNCSIIGAFLLPTHPLPSLFNIDLSNNEITGHIQSYNISSIFPNLVVLNMSTNAIGGSLPGEFGQMNSLYKLDLSHNQLSGEIPRNICGVSLRDLRLSNNDLSGSIPSSFFNSSLMVLDISSNHLVGKLPSKAMNSSNLVALSMSNNHLEGSIPAMVGELKSLRYLDISRNYLTGSLPSFVNSSLNIVHLGNNRLSGLGKIMFTGSSDLVALDISYNNITSRLQDVIHGLGHTRLTFLLLKGNHFMGYIPRQICQLTHLKFLDLSHNSLSGSIPNCLGEITFEIEKNGDLPNLLSGNYFYNARQIFFKVDEEDFTTKKITYSYIGHILGNMTGVDLSSNKLNGNIPSVLGNLTKIRALNLSHNCLTGQIPATFSNLVQIESLDLSFNKLSGNIPPQLSGLTSLEVFSVAHNNLSGATPDQKGQFITFNESSYENNPFLCGPPLPKSCSANGQPHALLPNDSYVDGDNNGNVVDMYAFCLSFAISYTMVLLVIVAILCINLYWRRAWFYYIELISTNCYYFIEDNLCKFPNTRK